MRHILASFRSGGMPVSQAASELGVSRSRLYQIYADYWRAVPGGSRRNIISKKAEALLRKLLSADPPCSYRFATSELLRRLALRTDSATVRRFAIANFLCRASWSFTSDAATKEGFRGVDAREVLRRIASLPVTEWNYSGYLQRHIGPMAQDWHSAFPLNKDDKAIDTADMHGVSLAATKGLVAELKGRAAQQAKDLSARDAEIDALKAKMEAMEERLNSVPPAH